MLQLSRGWFTGVFLAAAVAVPGCTHTVYTVRMRPTEQGFHRQLSCKEEKGGFGSAPDPEQAGRIAAIYPASAPGTNPSRFAAEGDFQDRTPADIGGAGTFTNTRTQLGTLHVYIERFRGQTDPAGELMRRVEYVDKAIDIIIGWLRSQVGTDPGFPDLREFMDTQVRRDVKNLAIIAWAAVATQAGDPAAIADEKTSRAFLERLVVVLSGRLIEGGYVAPDEAPRLLRCLGVGTDELRPASTDSGEDEARQQAQSAWLLALARRLIISKLDPAHSRPEPPLDFLASMDALNKSLEAFIATEPVATELMAWDGAHPLLKNAPASDASGAWSNLLLQASGADGILLSSDELNVELDCAAKPAATNGAWDADAHALRWSKLRLSGAEGSLAPPCHVYAVWAEPDADFQTRHFGRVLLEGQPLVAYASWRAELADGQRAEWDAFLETIHPGMDAAEAVRAFRFSEGPSPSPTPPFSLFSSTAATRK